MMIRIVRGSLLTKDNLYHHFYRADAPHEISLQPILIRLGIMYIPVTYEWLAELLRKMCYRYNQGSKKGTLCAKIKW